MDGDQTLKFPLEDEVEIRLYMVRESTSCLQRDCLFGPTLLASHLPSEDLVLKLNPNRLKHLPNSPKVWPR